MTFPPGNGVGLFLQLDPSMYGWRQLFVGGEQREGKHKGTGERLAKSKAAQTKNYYNSVIE